MTQVNYNLSFGGRKMSSPPKRNMGKTILFALLAVLVLSGGAWLVFMSPEAPRKPESASTINTKEKTTRQRPVPTPAPVEKNIVAPAPVKTIPEAVADKSLEPPVILPAPTTTSRKAAKPAPVGPDYFKLQQSAEEFYNNGEFVKAREAAEKALAQCTESSTEWLATARMLGRANIKIITTDCPFPAKKEKHRIVAGDALQKLAKKYNTTIEIIQRSNHMREDDNNVMLNRVFNIYKCNFRIIVNKKDFRLYLYDGDKIFKYYDIGIGKQGRTPLGKFHIVAKVEDPDWYSPHGKVMFKDKDNPIGTRWMQLKPDDGVDQDLSGYGIHGTWARDSIGKSRSNGCIRMLNEDVEELFGLIPHQTPVTIND